MRLTSGGGRARRWQSARGKHGSPKAPEGGQRGSSRAKRAQAPERRKERGGDVRKGAEPKRAAIAHGGTSRKAGGDPMFYRGRAPLVGAGGGGATTENRSRKHEPLGIKAPARLLWLRDRSSTSPKRWSP